MGAAIFFREKYDFLSNFYPHSIEYQGKTYPTSEHAYQAAKMLHEEDKEKIRNCETPGRAKRMGRELPALPSNEWNKIKKSIMSDILSIKFSDPVLKKKLLDVDEPIVEHNTWGDKYWGVCEGEGKNVLGKLLERIKRELEFFEFIDNASDL